LSKNNTSYLNAHSENIDIFRKIYYFVIDLLQLKDILEIFDELENPDIFGFILSDPKFHSLFITSFEMQKFVFVEETKEILT
jgi:hypothetical protein